MTRSWMILTLYVAQTGSVVVLKGRSQPGNFEYNDVARGVNGATDVDTDPQLVRQFFKL